MLNVRVDRKTDRQTDRLIMSYERGVRAVGSDREK